METPHTDVITSDIVQKVVTAHEVMRNGWREYFERALDNYKYVSGDQIDPEVEQQLKKDKRPALVFNLIQPKIITLAGILEANRVYLRAVPIQEGDEQAADMRTMLVSDWAMRNCNAYKEVIHAALDGAIAGIGWTNNYWDTQRHPQGMWVTERADPFSIMFDVEASKQDQSDWRYYDVTTMLSAEEIISVYRRYLSDEDVEAILAADQMIQAENRRDGSPRGWLDRLLSGFRDAFQERGGATTNSPSYDSSIVGDYADANVGRYRVIEFHDRRTTTKKKLVNTSLDDPYSQAEEIPQKTDGETWQEYHSRIIDIVAERNQRGDGKWVLEDVTEEELWITAVCPALLPSSPLMEEPYEVQGRGFQHKPIFCYPLHPDITEVSSIVDILRHPQDSYNQRRMSALEWIMKAINPDVLAPEGSISSTNLNDWKSKKRGRLLFATARNGMMPQELQPHPQVLAAITGMAEEDRELTELLTNITPNLLGMSENAGESGVLFAQRVQRSMQALSYLFGNITLSMKEIFNYCDRSLQVFMTMPRKVRLLDKSNQPQWIKMNWQTLEGVHNDISQGEFDFDVDTTQLGETAKQIKFREAIEFVGMVAQYKPQGILWNKLFELWDSPIASEMGEFMKQIMAAELGMQAQAAQAQSVADASASMGLLQQTADLAMGLQPDATGGLDPQATSNVPLGGAGDLQ